MEITARAFASREPPRFETKAAERCHVLERLAAACRILGSRGHAEGLLGHLTVRDPEDPDRFWVNPVGVAMREVRAAHLVQVDHAGRRVSGDGMVNPVGLLLHTAVHRARPDVVAVCHSHSVHGSAWSSLGRPLAPITQDACLFHGNQAVIREPRIVRDVPAAERFAAAFGDKRVAIHAGHGLFTTGGSVDEAAWWFVLMDRCCQVQLLAEAAGTPECWPDADAQWLASVLGPPEFGWLSFQTLLDGIIAADGARAE